ncbi:hypothetical protein HYS94_03195 [Candidatus Daviesbacteria bacterium]|nr:hypothetical protein [Candidatus Daviesbacteria bacterium]MBI4035339.1 hypothetical protein [Candidatus Daviesbacteria bacterium]
MREQENVNLSNLLAQPKVLQAEADKLQRSIGWETLTSRGKRGFIQYGSYFAAMWGFGLIYSEESRLFRSANFYWRFIDDIADKDRPLSPWYKSREEFLQHKKGTIHQLFSQPESTIYGDKEDILLADYYSTSRKLGVDLSQESFDILDSIIFDEERARERRILTQQELDEYFGQLDPACIRGALKVAGETCDHRNFDPLSLAVRTMFNLRDFPKDFRDGLINMSEEDIKRYGVELEALRVDRVEQFAGYHPMRRWYQDQITAGQYYLDVSRKILSRLELKKITRFVTRAFFERPAQTTLGKYAKIFAA